MQSTAIPTHPWIGP